MLHFLLSRHPNLNCIEFLQRSTTMRLKHPVAPRKAYFRTPKPLPTQKPRRAAQYVRMSTGNQQYSIEYQKEVIADYARLRGIDIIRTYTDAARSGLSLKRRDALKQLISDVESGLADFSIVLVYDVSRWGRFQDVDESAYYEFICKSAGISVQYCAEPFENNDSIISALLKGLKRAMAGEYSRELSTKISRAHKRLAALGYHQGGRANFGLRRVVVDEHGHPKGELLSGQEKNLQRDRVILVPGPESEIRIVREIFRLFVVERVPKKRIAKMLNKRGLRTGLGNLWSGSNIHHMLTNEKYVGNYVYNRTSLKMQGNRIYYSKDQWLRAEGVIEPIIDRKMFDAAQRLLKESWTVSDNELLDYLTAIWCVSGYLSANRVNQTSCAPTSTTYRERFGNLSNAYRLIGYKATHHYRYTNLTGLLRQINRDLICRLIESVERNEGSVSYGEKSQTLRVNDSITVSTVVIPYLSRNEQGKGWKLYFEWLPECDLILLVRMNKANTKVLDYHLLPCPAFARPSFRFTDKNLSQLKQYKLASPAKFYPLCMKLSSALRDTARRPATI